jgi:hypothetical protein
MRMLRLVYVEMCSFRRHFARHKMKTVPGWLLVRLFCFAFTALILWDVLECVVPQDSRFLGVRGKHKHECLSH